MMVPMNEAGVCRRRASVDYCVVIGDTHFGTQQESGSYEAVTASWPAMAEDSG